METEYELGDESQRSYYLYVSGNWGRAKGIDGFLKLARMNPDKQFRAYGSADVTSPFQMPP